MLLPFIALAAADGRYDVHVHGLPGEAFKFCHILSRVVVGNIKICLAS